MVTNQCFRPWIEVCHQIFGGWEVQTHVKFIEECVRCMGKACFLPLWTWVERAVYGVETHYLVKKKFLAQQSVKKVMLTVLRHERARSLLISLRNGAGINMVSWKENEFLFFLKLSVFIYWWYCISWIVWIKVDINWQDSIVIIFKEKRNK